MGSDKSQFRSHTANRVVGWLQLYRTRLGWPISGFQDSRKIIQNVTSIPMKWMIVVCPNHNLVDWTHQAPRRPVWRRSRRLRKDDLVSARQIQDERILRNDPNSYVSSSHFDHGSLWQLPMNRTNAFGTMSLRVGTREIVA